jgi:membrane protein
MTPAFDQEDAHRLAPAQRWLQGTVSNAFGPAARLLVDSARQAWEDNGPRLAASLSFYAVFSVFPVLLLSVTALGFVLGDGPESRANLLDLVTRFSSPELRSLIDSTLASMQSHHAARGVSAVIGASTLVVGGSAAFSDLKTTMEQIWRVPAVRLPGLHQRIFQAIRDKAIALLGVGSVALAILGWIVGGAAIAIARANAYGPAPGTDLRSEAWGTVASVAWVGALTLAFAAALRLIPNVRARWRDVTGGALLTAVLFVVLKRIFTWYLAHMAGYAAYGAVGGFLAFLMWVYLASLLLIYGTEVAHLYATRHGSLRP